MTVWEFSRGFSHPFLRWCLRNAFLPTMSTASLFILLGQLEAGDLALVEGGSLDFAMRVSKRYGELGGEVTYGSTVEEIMVDNDRAVGVRLADGSEHRADIVVSATDGHSTIFEMLRGSYLDETIRQRYARWPLSPRIAIVSFGVGREFRHEPPASVVRLVSPVTVGDHHFEGFRMRLFNYDPTLAPSGKTVVQVALGTEFDWWYGLHEGDRCRYEEEKEGVAAAVLEQLETYFPGITAQVEVTDVATPYTWLHYTRNYQGSSMAWLTTPETSRTPIEKTLPGLSNFYMAGQWVGEGGIKGALYSGRNLVKTICERDGKRFSVRTP
jgi:phytoene dehydrogenase-like protein